MSKLIILYSDRLEAYCGNFNYTKKFSVPIFSFVCLLLVKESFYTAIQSKNQDASLRKKGPGRERVWRTREEKSSL